jgi:exonuclease III
MKAKVLIWNCNKSFRTKCNLFLKNKYDILVISECENPAEIIFPQDWLDRYSYKWIGKNKNSGLCIFARKDWKLKILKELYDSKVSYVLPVKIVTSSGLITLFAIWACAGKKHEHKYIGQVWLYLKKHLKKFPPKGVLMAGDFNSNSIWDRKHRDGNHTDVVRKLQSKGLESIYHALHNEPHGSETSSTLFMYRKKNKGYHIDYCFASPDIIKNKKDFKIGSYPHWIKYSDHMPITMKID